MGDKKIDQPAANSDDSMAEPVDKSFHISKKLVYILLAVVFVALVAVTIFVLGNRKSSAPAPAAQSQAKSTPKKTVSQTKPVQKDTLAECAAGLTRYSDTSFGAAFCYPTAWGTATLADAKVASSDTGHREQITFSSMPLFSVGGTSEDWSTTVGRGVGCLEPSNSMPELSSYNTAWHDMSGSGMAVEFALRSLPSSAGGYSITETVSNVLQDGVCAQGHKQINGSRYRVVSAAFYRTFAEASGITTPSAHIAEPNVLFSTLQRSQFDALLASLVAY